jgi:hypothetical protein
MARIKRGVLSIAAGAVLLALLGAGCAASPGVGAACTTREAATGFHSPDHIPGPCWRPYSDTSPFNTPIRRHAHTAPGSRKIVSSLLRGGQAGELVAGDPALEGSSNPAYYAGPSDPVFTLHCFENYGPRCSIEGMAIHVPDRAMPGGGFSTSGHRIDAHMTIVDGPWEYDLFEVTAKPPGGGQLTFGWGGRTRIDGSGLGSDATAARFGNLAGAIRGSELDAAHIDHALRMVVPCVSGRVYPAEGQGAGCAGVANRSAPHSGARFQLALSAKEIRRLRLPAWKAAIAMALHKYGAYVSDTTGSPELWGFEQEGGEGYASFGLEDPMVTLGRRLGLEHLDFNRNGYDEYRFRLAPGIPWGKLRVVRPPSKRS